MLKIVSCPPVDCQKSQSGGRDFFFFLFLIFHGLDCTKKIEKKKTFFKNHEKKVPVGLFLAHPASGQETTFYLRVA